MIRAAAVTVITAVAVLIVGGSASAQVSACASSSRGAAASRPQLPTSIIHCAELVPPPELRAASGVLELRPVTGPFGVAVTPAGAPRYVLAARIAGLPAPSTLGRYTTYVAWAYTITMDSAVRLGEVRNGVTVLGELAREQFRVLITAEGSSQARARSSRLVLRATSPGARLLAHRDLMQPVPPGFATMLAVPPKEAGHEHGTPESRAAATSALAWRTPPMPQGQGTMMPGLHHAIPSEAPWLPKAGDGANLVEAVPRRVATLRDGDTLLLVASRVRRTIGGRRLVMYGFNGQYPGPLIRAPRGATVIVRFENRLDQPSTVHWHGVRLDNRFDGVPGITQAEVPPGGDFVYHVHFRDAGIYWYHPHVREDAQQDLGLYGNILVAPGDRRFLPPVDREEVLALDDLLLDEQGIVPYGATLPTHALMGRWGNVFLVNGEPRYRLHGVRAGEVVRFYLTNVSNARVYNVSFGRARMKVVASDGGKFERETWATSVVLAPAERYVVDVRFDGGDVAVTNRVQALDHMYGTYTPTTDTLGVVVVGRPGSRGTSNAARAFDRLRVNADVAGDLAQYRKYFDRLPDRTLVLDLRTRALPPPVAMMLNGLNVPMDWNDGMAMANWIVTGREVTWILRDAETGRENMDVAWRFRRGDVVKMRLFNDPTSAHAMAHPIHVHGQRFLILARNGVRNDNLVWKDTGIIPAGEAVDLLVEMSNPGTWLLHCHVAEHMGAGMMLSLVVE